MRPTRNEKNCTLVARGVGSASSAAAAGARSTGDATDVVVVEARAARAAVGAVADTVVALGLARLLALLGSSLLARREHARGLGSRSRSSSGELRRRSLGSIAHSNLNVLALVIALSLLEGALEGALEDQVGVHNGVVTCAILAPQ